MASAHSNRIGNENDVVLSVPRPEGRTSDVFAGLTVGDGYSQNLKVGNDDRGGGLLRVHRSPDRPYLLLLHSSSPYLTNMEQL